MTTSTPSNEQIEKLLDKVRAAVRKSEFTSQQFQAALGQPGTELENGILLLLKQFARKASGIVTPLSALETGLVPDGWTIEKDESEGEINLAKLDFDFAPCKKSEGSINGDTMLERAAAANALGTLGFAKIVLDAQKEGKDIIPTELRGQKYIILSRTVLRLRGGDRLVPCLYWDGGEWCLLFLWLDGSFDSHGVVPRVRE